MIIRDLVNTWCPRCNYQFQFKASKEYGYEEVKCPKCGARQIVVLKTILVKKVLLDSDPELVEEWERQFE